MGGLLRLWAAALAGAAGIGGEALLLTAIGLAIGQARAAAFGLAAWIAAWALGAWLAGRLPLPPRRALLLWGSVSALGIPCALEFGLGLGELSPGPHLYPLVIAAIALAALPQGGFLPLLARAGRSRDVSWLLGANLLGGVFGARALAFTLPGLFGLRPAALVAGALALSAGLSGCLSVPRCAPGGAAAEGEATHPTPSRASTPAGSRSALLRSGAIVGLVTAWLAGIEWLGLRLGALWLGGMQPAITAVLVATLLSLALGSVLLPRLLAPRSRGLGAALPLALTLAALGMLVMVLGDPAAWVEEPRARPLEVALFLVLPALAPLGAVIPLLYRSLAGESGARLGGMLLHEAWGALLGVPLVHLWLVPTFGVGGAGAALVLLALPALALFSGPLLWRALAAALVLAASLWAARAEEPALRTPSLARPEFEVLAFREDAHFAVSVVHDGLRGETTLLTDDFRATAVGDDYLYMRLLAHLPLLLHPGAGRVGVLAFGTGTTAGSVSLYPGVEALHIFEISPAVCAMAGYFDSVNRGVLDDERTHLHLGDGRRTLGSFEGAFDVLTMEPLLPDAPFAVHLYTPGFYRRARRALASGGLLCQWVPPQALEPATFDAVLAAFRQAFPWSGVFLFGTQVILLGGDKLPALDPSAFETSTPELAGEWARLGIETPAGLVARLVSQGGPGSAAQRPLRDADPWIVFRPRRQGTVLLGDLPRNLAGLRHSEGELPLSWRLVVGEAGQARLREVRRLHRARESWARAEYDLRRSLLPLEARPAPLPAKEELESPEEYLAQLAESDDPEVRLFLKEVRFVRGYREGVAALTQGDVAQAFRSLGQAGKLRPAAADVHLHAALAAYLGGRSDVARALADEAYRLCPRILETGPGERVLSLGLPPSLLPEHLAR